ncbi:MAG: SRPBCC family protein [Desulfobacterales bacterium]
MTLSLIARLIISAIALIVISRNAEATSDLSESQLLQLKSGAVLVAVQQADEPSKGMVEATILIDAPAESIWQIMVNCHEIPTFVPGLKACQVLMAGENWEIIRHEVKWMWLLPRLSYVFRAIYQPNRQIDFVKIEGDLREMKGTWRLTPLNETGQTIVRYSVYLDPGFFVPQWIVRQSLKADLPAILTALRTEVLESRTRNKP